MPVFEFVCDYVGTGSLGSEIEARDDYRPAVADLLAQLVPPVPWAAVDYRTWSEILTNTGKCLVRVDLPTNLWNQVRSTGQVRLQIHESVTQVEIDNELNSASLGIQFVNVSDYLSKIGRARSLQRRRRE